MTEEKSRNLLENKLRAMTDADAPNFWIGPLVADSSSAFVMPMTKIHRKYAVFAR